MHKTNDDDRLTGLLVEAMVTLGDALGDEEMMLLSTGEEGDLGVVLVAQGDTAQKIVNLVESLKARYGEDEKARNEREARLWQYRNPQGKTNAN